ncbi:MAG TPA: hypothetical protein VJY33_11605, partial [Isosphaeraceae bacterium]|nr:hypothetical protein [Isosphaeraceae bacterium]
MSLANNLRVAQEAIAYVNNRLPLPSPNWPGVNVWVRDSADASVKALGGRAIPSPQAIVDVKNTAKQVAELSKSGYCGEKSAVAFTYAQEKGYKVALVQIVNGNHEFVVVGGYLLKQFANQYQPGQYPRHTVRPTVVPDDIFGRTAVICDPWFLGGYAEPLHTHW